MSRELYRWVPTGESDMVELRDLRSGRAVQIVRPDDADLPGDLLLEIESLVFRWSNRTTHAEAEADLAVRWEAVDSLRAMSWLCALWAVVCETRLGKSADDIIRDLDYRGGWRTLRTAEDAQLWEGLTQRVRLGALAALTEDPRAAQAYYEACVESTDVGSALLRHTLIHLDALGQDMRRHDIDPRGLATAVVTHTMPNAGRRRRLCFRPSHVA
ncbi:hypothetical protein IU500_11690 [Nocardia terpenica]|uniref:Uncharacterized protein n=1 Tax=Nocardia terpenica TaxID=455432 RepID=A0A164HJK0_9NOCA|nr:hypothetical protein [Nocardia terpenica]KZM68571.1 hypothetical protein AWN90_12015 [Nocardia terpenica]MBF6062617.1 hypothetical protein [Nocardia terpenica]MBF6104705.1 hypothetical protein [Nocardia terpenica]MBF6116460.1 hypothetical protein [Nocardia terpenica]MBF6123423.1 hypothetical protein [Nocardia terpenica]